MRRAVLVTIILFSFASFACFACGSGDTSPPGSPKEDAQTPDAAGADGPDGSTTVEPDAGRRDGGAAPSCTNTHTDTNNCGRCGHVCLPASTCSQGICSSTLVAKACVDDPSAPDAGGCQNLAPSSVALGATEVVWGLAKGNSVLAAPKNGGATRIVTQALRAQGLAVHDGRVHIAESLAGRITSTTLTGAAPIYVPGENGAHGLVVGGTTAVWLANDATSPTSVIGIASLTGDVATHVSAGGYVNGLVSDGTTIYFSNYDRNAIMTVPVTGGEPVALVTGQPGPWCMAMTANELFWASVDSVTGKRAIMRSSKGGGAVSVFASDTAGPLTTDGNAIYWVDEHSGLQRKDIVGGATSTVAVARVDYRCQVLAVDGTAVYWADTLQGNILKAAR